MCFTISSSVSTELQCDSVCGMCNLLVHWLKTNWVDTVSSASENDLVTHALNGTGCNVHSRKRFCVADEVGFHVRLGPPVWLYLGNLIFFIPLLRGPAPPGGGGAEEVGVGPPGSSMRSFVSGTSVINHSSIINGSCIATCSSTSYLVFNEIYVIGILFLLVGGLMLDRGGRLRQVGLMI